MILSELVKLYDRMALDEEFNGRLPTLGRSKQNVSFEVVLDKQGNLIDVEDESEGFDEILDVNKKVKLDLFLENCVDESLLRKVVESIDLEYVDVKSAISSILENIRFDEFLRLKDEFSDSSVGSDASFKLLNNAFEDLAVIKVIVLAKDYGIPIAGNKESLIKNFVEKFSFDELCDILTKNNLPISVESSDIEDNKCILEQIYDLDLDSLKD